jgi:phage-related protein
MIGSVLAKPMLFGKAIVWTSCASSRSRFGKTWVGTFAGCNLGERPLSSRSMASVGARVFELRQMDDKGWYRVIYLGKVGNRLHMLHAFMKKSAKTSPNDLRIATARLKIVNARLLEEKRNARKSK